MFACHHPTDKNFPADPSFIYLFTIFIIFSRISIFRLKTFQKVYIENNKDIDVDIRVS